MVVVVVAVPFDCNCFLTFDGFLFLLWLPAFVVGATVDDDDDDDDAGDDDDDADAALFGGRPRPRRCGRRGCSRSD